MLSNFEVAIYAFSFVLLPLALYSLATGSQAPPNSWLTKYYAAERFLGPVGNVMLIALTAGSFVRLAMNFGLIESVNSDDVAALVSAPFAILAIVYFALWIRAFKKVRGKPERGTHV